MERAPDKEQKVLEVGPTCSLWSQHVSTGLARWLELQLIKSSSFSITGLGGLRVTAKRRRFWVGDELRSQGHYQTSPLCPPCPNFVPQAAVPSELKAGSRKLHFPEGAACTLTCLAKHSISTLSHLYNLPSPKITILQVFRPLAPVTSPSSTWQLWS